MSIEVGGPAYETKDSWMWPCLLAAVGLGVVLRVLCFPFAAYTGGWTLIDAPTRVAMAVRWLEHPGVLTTRDCHQFGPLHIYLIGTMLAVWRNVHDAPRLLSLLFAIATMAPLYLIAREMFGRGAAVLTLLFCLFHVAREVQCGGHVGGALCVLLRHVCVLCVTLSSGGPRARFVSGRSDALSGIYDSIRGMGLCRVDGPVEPRFVRGRRLVQTAHEVTPMGGPLYRYREPLACVVDSDQLCAGG